MATNREDNNEHATCPGCGNRHAPFMNVNPQPASIKSVLLMVFHPNGGFMRSVGVLQEAVPYNEKSLLDLLDVMTEKSIPQLQEGNFPHDVTGVLLVSDQDERNTDVESFSPENMGRWYLTEAPQVHRDDITAYLLTKLGAALKHTPRLGNGEEVTEGDVYLN